MRDRVKTISVMKRLRVGYWRLYELIRVGKIDAPVRDDSGDYWWSSKDVEAARAALTATDTKRAARKARREALPI
jgi:hypothetical protein